MLIACVGAVGLILTSPAPDAIRTAFGATALAWLATAFTGYRAIRRGQVDVHRRWMIGCYLVTLAPITFRALIRIPGTMELASPMVMIPTLLWLSWAAPLLVYGGGVALVRVIKRSAGFPGARYVARRESNPHDCDPALARVLRAPDVSGTLPRLHQAFVEKVRTEVSRDPRLTALLAGGSYIHGGFDRYSDLDFVVVVESGGYPEVMAARRQFAESLGNLLSAFSGEHVGEPRLLICLYGPALLHVDLKFIVADDLNRLVERPTVLFARDAADIEARLDAASSIGPSAPRNGSNSGPGSGCTTARPSWGAANCSRPWGCSLFSAIRYWGRCFMQGRAAAARDKANGNAG